MTNAEFELFKILIKKTPEIPEKFKIMDFIGMKYLTTENEPKYGAWGILNADMQKEIIRRYGECIVIPSSIHEVILLPTESEFGSLDADSLATQIKEVNEMEVAPEEILSDHAYLLTAYGVVDYK